jgi:hypothetical protein
LYFEKDRRFESLEFCVDPTRSSKDSMETNNREEDIVDDLFYAGKAT